MGLEEVIRFANANNVAYIATVDDEDNRQPRVRAMDMWKVDPTGFYFHNNSTRGVHDQLARNPKVELFFPSRGGGREALRVVGTAEILSDAALAEEYYSTPGKNKYRRPDGFTDMMVRVTGDAWFRTDAGKRGQSRGAPMEMVAFPAR